MTTPYLGEIQVFGFNYTPYGWASCNGATLQIRQNTALFSLIGTQYGGDGVNTFQLPNFTGRAPCSQGQGPGLTPRVMGETFGTNTVQLDATQIPAHTHQLTLSRQTDPSLQRNVPQTGDGLTSITGTNAFVPAATPNTTLSPQAVASAGSGQAHENRQPMLALNFCIALQGEFPAFD
ncbi:Microcystin-dependent protein [Janthinobacterium sp. OK676]|uniref:phage tail protein n=1 Tax=unclassified Janthinobacterium TaxID=2610881 RepID=UPI00088108B9|nr:MULTISPECIES: tail fiber protein [unclassified Janthinobacterium]PJJ19006.1 microcystin-dependent protein [Janthinobacterium sp. 67]SDL85108.1 Microcystin-dependent protein [Janthinobacterium sp. OK676]